MFPKLIISLFTLATVEQAVKGEWKLFWIYALSAALNVVFLME
jgi:hypothetical protein